MKILNKKSADKCSGKSLAVVIIAAILSFSIVSFTDMMTSNSANAQNTTSSNNQTQAGQLSFFLKLADGSNQTSAQTSTDPANLKNITINVNVQQGQEPPKKLPISALVPKATTLEQLELCGSVGDQPEQCQPLSGESISLDLTGGQQAQNNASTTATQAPPSTQPQSYSMGFEMAQFTNIAFSNNAENYGLSSAAYSPSDAYFVPVQLIDDVNVNVPIDIDVTAIIPINIEIENAQICANLGGTQTCQINNINPTTNEFSPTNIDLASEEPAVTTQPAPTTTAPTTTAPTTTAPTTTAPTTTAPTTTAPTTTAPTTTAPEDTTTSTAPTASTTESTPEDTTTSTAPTASTTESTPEDTTTSSESTDSESEPANTEDTESSN